MSIEEGLKALPSELRARFEAQSELARQRARNCQASPSEVELALSVLLVLTRAAGSGADA